MKIATPAEPEGREGERGKLNEIFAQVNEGAVLELGEAAGFAGHEENFKAARIAGMFVAAKGAWEIWMSLQARGEDDGVFDGEAGTLAESGADGMSGVAEDGDAADDPGERGKAVLNFCADGAFGVFDEFGDGRMPGGKKFLQGGAF